MYGLILGIVALIISVIGLLKIKPVNKTSIPFIVAIAGIILNLYAIYC